MSDTLVSRVAAVQSALVEQGFTLACAKATDIEQATYFVLAPIRVKCNGDKPGDWKYCRRGGRGDDGFCAHAYGDLCVIAPSNVEFSGRTRSAGTQG